MSYQSLFKWWHHLHYCRNYSQRQFEHRKFDANLLKSSSPKLLDKILRYFIQIVLRYVLSKLFKWWCYLHYWRNNSQRQFEHRKFDANLLKSSSPKLLDKILRYFIQIVLRYVLSKLFKWWRYLHYWRNNSQRQFEHRKFDANLLKSSFPKLLNKIVRYYIQIVLRYV